MRIYSSLWRTRLSRQAAGKIAGGEIHKREIEWSSRTSAELNSSCPGLFTLEKIACGRSMSKRITGELGRVREIADQAGFTATLVNRYLLTTIGCRTRLELLNLSGKNRWITLITFGRSRPAADATREVGSIGCSMT